MTIMYTAVTSNVYLNHVTEIPMTNAVKMRFVSSTKTIGNAVMENVFQKMKTVLAEQRMIAMIQIISVVP